MVGHHISSHQDTVSFSETEFQAMPEVVLLVLLNRIQYTLISIELLSKIKVIKCLHDKVTSSGDDRVLMFLFLEGSR